MTEMQKKVLSELLAEAYYHNLQTALTYPDSEAQLKKLNRYAMSHLVSFLTYLGVSYEVGEEINKMSLEHYQKIVKERKKKT